MVSIHARVERATNESGALQPGLMVSIHARVERATTFRFFSVNIIPCFNPRTRRACDVDMFDGLVRVEVSIHARVERATGKKRRRTGAKIVSIHARVERATSVQNPSERIRLVSIHARVERATDAFSYSTRYFRFQSTHA